jgi:hypothetical protein
MNLLEELDATRRGRSMEGDNRDGRITRNNYRYVLY